MKAITKAGLVLGAAIVLAAIAAIPMVWRPGAADAAEGNPDKGREIALDKCSRCHAVVPGAESPVAEAPRFETLGQMWPIDYLEEALAEGIMVGHEQYQMPVFQFTTEEIADLIAYLKSIQVGPQAEAPANEQE